MSSSMGRMTSHIWNGKKHVWNHQPELYKPELDEQIHKSQCILITVSILLNCEGWGWGVEWQFWRAQWPQTRDSFGISKGHAEWLDLDTFIPWTSNVFALSPCKSACHCGSKVSTWTWPVSNVGGTPCQDHQKPPCFASAHWMRYGFLLFLRAVVHLPSGYLTVRHGKWPIEIDGLPFLKMVDLSSSLC